MDETLNKLAAKTYLLEETKSKYYELAFEMLNLQKELEVTEKTISELSDEILTLRLSQK
jgi:K+/H+ antiporter YhaU regulatory subunit KhtT